MDIISITYEEMIFQMKKEALKEQKWLKAQDEDHLLQASRSTDSKPDWNQDEMDEDPLEEIEGAEITEEHYRKKFNDLNKAYWGI